MYVSTKCHTVHGLCTLPIIGSAPQTLLVQETFCQYLPSVVASRDIHLSINYLYILVVRMLDATHEVFC